MKLIKQLIKLSSICIACTVSLLSVADSPTLQITYGKLFNQGKIDFERNSNQALVTEDFLIEGQSVEVKYIYSPYTALAVSYHMLESCSIEKAKTKLGCHIDTPIEGGNFELLTGLNMDGKGLYLFTGVGYYIEDQQDTTFEELYIPVGVGVNLNMFVIEATYEFRNSDSYDAYSYDMFSETDPDYTLTNTANEALAPTHPITLSVGVRF